MRAACIYGLRHFEWGLEGGGASGGTKVDDLIPGCLNPACLQDEGLVVQQQPAPPTEGTKRPLLFFFNLLISSLYNYWEICTFW